MSTTLQSFSMWSKSKRWKKLSKWVPHELTENQKIVILNCHLYLFYITTMNNFSIRLWRATKSEFYTTRNDQLRVKRSSKALSKVKFAPKKGCGQFGGQLPVWSTTAFWILEKPLYLKDMLSKLMRCTKNCNICSQHWSTERVKFFSMTIPDHTLHNHTSKFEWIGLGHFASSAIFPWPLANWLSLFKHLDNFLQGKCFHNQQNAKNDFQEFIESWSTDFYTTRIIKLISQQKCIDCNGL